jgi:hypothetical protein
VRGLGTQDPGGQRAQLRRQVLLRQALERPGRHVAHRHAGGHLDDRGQVAARRAGEHLDLDPELGERVEVSTT